MNTIASQSFSSGSTIRQDRQGGEPPLERLEPQDRIGFPEDDKSVETPVCISSGSITFETIGNVVQVAGTVVEKTGGFFQDLNAAVKGIMTDEIFPQQTPKKNELKPEQIARLAQIDDLMQDLQKKMGQITAEEAVKNTYRIVGEGAAALTDAKKNDLLRLQSRYRREHPDNIYETVEMRKALLGQEKIVMKMEMAQKSAVTQQVVNLNAQEGGTAGAKTSGGSAFNAG